MKKSKKMWYSENENSGNSFARERLLAEIKRIRNLKVPVQDKIREIGQLVENYFNTGSNEEFLNANLP